MKKRAILVVDDDPSILSTLAEFLDMEGFSVQTASATSEPDAPLLSLCRNAC